jgi:hypothetical protein
VGITATRKIPIKTPVSRDVAANKDPTTGETRKMTIRAAAMPFTSIRPDLICLAFNDNPEKKNMRTITASGPWCILSHLPMLETVSLVSATVTIKTRRSPIKNQYFLSKPDTLMRPHDIADFSCTHNSLNM